MKKVSISTVLLILFLVGCSTFFSPMVWYHSNRSLGQYNKDCLLAELEAVKYGRVTGSKLYGSPESKGFSDGMMTAFNKNKIRQAYMKALDYHSMPMERAEGLIRKQGGKYYRQK